MKTKYLFIWVLLVMLTLLGGCSSPLTPNKTQKDIIQHLRRSTVEMIYPIGEQSLTFCSGVWITPSKFLTARHCVEPDETGSAETATNKNLLKYIPGSIFKYKVYDGEKIFHAVVVAYDPKADLALLSSIEQSPHEFVRLTSEVYDGEDCQIVGHPGGLKYTYFKCSVSNALKTLTPFGEEWKLTQISAPIWRGNSGGGVFNLHGDLIGIVSFMRRDIPLTSYAVHFEQIREFISKN